MSKIIVNVSATNVSPSTDVGFIANNLRQVIQSLTGKNVHVRVNDTKSANASSVSNFLTSVR